MTKLQCSWPAPIDIDGLNDDDKAKIKKIGLKAWIKEQQSRPKPAGAGVRSGK